MSSEMPGTISSYHQQTHTEVIGGILVITKRMVFTFTNGMNHGVDVTVVNPNNIQPSEDHIEAVMQEEFNKFDKAFSSPGAVLIESFKTLSENGFDLNEESINTIQVKSASIGK